MRAELDQTLQTLFISFKRTAGEDEVSRSMRFSFYAQSAVVQYYGIYRIYRNLLMGILCVLLAQFNTWAWCAWHARITMGTTHNQSLTGVLSWQTGHLLADRICSFKGSIDGTCFNELPAKSSDSIRVSRGGCLQRKGCVVMETRLHV